MATKKVNKSPNIFTIKGYRDVPEKVVFYDGKDLTPLDEAGIDYTVVKHIDGDQVHLPVGGLLKGGQYVVVHHSGRNVVRYRQQVIAEFVTDPEVGDPAELDGEFK